MDVDYKMFDKHAIGQRIKARQEKLGLSQSQLGVKIGTNGNNISNYEIGCSCPNLERFTRLCVVLNVSADEILGLSAKQI